MPTHVTNALSASSGRQHVNQRGLRSPHPRRHPPAELSPRGAASVGGLSGWPGTVLSVPAGQHPDPAALALYRSQTYSTVAQAWDSSCDSGVRLPPCHGHMQVCACVCLVGLCCVCLIPVTYSLLSVVLTSF